MQRFDDILVTIGNSRAIVQTRCTIPEKILGTIFVMSSFTGMPLLLNNLRNKIFSLGYQIVEFDMVGRGKSSYVRSIDYNLENYIAIFIQLINHYSVGKLIIAGHGWSGAICAVLSRAMIKKKPLLILSDVDLVWSVDNDLEVHYMKILERNINIDKVSLSNELISHVRPYADKNAFVDLFLKNKWDSENQKYVTCDLNCLESLAPYAEKEFDMIEILSDSERVLLLGNYNDGWSERLNQEAASSFFHVVDSQNRGRIGFSGQEDELAIIGYLS